MSGPGGDRAGLSAVVARVGAEHHVMLIDARTMPLRSILLSPDDWEAMRPHINLMCELAKAPGKLPDLTPVRPAPAPSPAPTPCARQS